MISPIQKFVPKFEAKKDLTGFKNLSGLLALV